MLAFENDVNIKAFIVLGNVMLVTVIVMVATGILIVSVVIFQVSTFEKSNWFANKRTSYEMSHIVLYLRAYFAMENCVISKSLQNVTANHQK